MGLWESTDFSAWKCNNGEKFWFLLLWFMYHFSMLYLVQRGQAFCWFVHIPHLWTFSMKCFHKFLLLSNSQWLIIQLPLVSTLLKIALSSSTTLRMHWHHIWLSHGFYANPQTPAPFNGKHITGRRIPLFYTIHDLTVLLVFS